MSASLSSLLFSVHWVVGWLDGWWAKELLFPLTPPEVFCERSPARGWMHVIQGATFLFHSVHGAPTSEATRSCTVH